MNLVGKIFIVLIFIMSLLWMGFAVAVYATHRNWREYVMNETATADKPLGVLPQLKGAEQRVTELKDQKDRLQAELDRQKQFRREALAKSETEKEELQNQLDQREQEYAQEVQERRDAVAAMDAAQKRLEAQTAELQRLRDEIRQVQEDRDQKMQQVVDLMEQLNQEKMKNQTLEARRQILEADNAEMKRRLRLSRLPVPPEPWVDEPPPPVDGLVLAVGSSGSVEINLGSDDGLHKGHHLEVTRGNVYVGRVQVVETQPDRAVAKVVPGMQQSRIQRGDRVYSQLSSR